MKRAEYRPVNQYQQDHCVWCVHDATQEAVRSEGNMTAICRCCGDSKCVSLSAEKCEQAVGA